MPLPDAEVQALISLARRYLTQEETSRVIDALEAAWAYEHHASYHATMDAMRRWNEEQWPRLQM